RGRGAEGPARDGGSRAPGRLRPEGPPRRCIPEGEPGVDLGPVVMPAPDGDELAVRADRDVLDRPGHSLEGEPVAPAVGVPDPDDDRVPGGALGPRQPGARSNPGAVGADCPAVDALQL